jgi:hypothetical protein
MPGVSSIEDLLADSTPEVGELTFRLRDLIRSVMPDATERIYPGWHGIGFHHPTAGYVCALFPGADRVRVGFEHGHLLPDPGGVFDSGGKQVRYITVHELSPDLADRILEFVDHAAHLRDH